MTYPLRNWIVLLAALLLTACAATPKRFENVVVYGRNVQIERVSEHILDGGEVQVVVFGQSTAGYSRSIRYRALWSDAEGRPIKTTVSTWSEMTLDAHRPFSMQFVGPGPRARSYRVEIEVLGSD